MHKNTIFDWEKVGGAKELKSKRGAALKLKNRNNQISMLMLLRYWVRERSSFLNWKDGKIECARRIWM